MERRDWTREERSKSNIRESKRRKWREEIGQEKKEIKVI